ncbi:hypothetical protein JCM10450v2_003529 [Rhodotorula kratochvilovae]
MSLSLYHLPLAGYFALIGALAVAVAPTFAPKRLNTPAVGFLVLAVVSLGFTWTYMLRYFQHSFEDSAHRHGVLPHLYSSHDWLADVSLFHEAWHYVCDGATRWWWSQQLCMWTTGPLTLLFMADGRKYGVKRVWAYMLLGQVVAISFAQSLWAAAAVVAASSAAASASTPVRARTRRPEISVGLGAAIILGSASVVFVPRTLSSAARLFLPNLLFMHTVILLPFIPALAARDWRIRPRLSRLYLNFAFVALRFRAPLLMELLGKDQPFALHVVRERLPALLAQQWETALAHPAQASISYDVVFTSVSALAYLAWSSRARKAGVRHGEEVAWGIVALMALATPLVGIATSVSVGLAIREGKREAREDAEEKVEKARREQAVRELQGLGKKDE